jgi:hypothetical protein
MNWMEIDEMTASVPLPAGYRYDILKRSEIPALIGFITRWFPDISVGSASCYVRPDFYSDKVSLAGEQERDTFVILLKRDQELVGLFSCERDLMRWRCTRVWRSLLRRYLSQSTIAGGSHRTADGHGAGVRMAT